MTNTLAIRIAAIAGFLGVALGAFGAHSFKEVLAQNATREVWQTAVQYHLIHAVILLVLAYRSPVRRGPFFCFLFGILIFSGTLYLLAITNLKWLGAITPFGGVSFLIGWGWLCCVRRENGVAEPSPKVEE